MERDTLFLVQPGFQDPDYPGRRFYCWHCALLEGVLLSFPQLAARLNVHRVPWPRPRAAVIALVGPQNQSLPLLVLAEGPASRDQAAKFENRAFLAGKDNILAALSDRHGFPYPHP